MKYFAVFCGSNTGNNPRYPEAARTLGRTLAEKGYGLVYGGGRVGLMGVVARSAAEAGASVIGVMPQDLVDKEIALHDVGELRIVKSMHERKAMMADLASGFIALPGGFGTFEEWFEVITWAQLGYHKKPCGLFNVDGFYDLLIEFIKKSTKSDFITKENARFALADSTAEGLLTQFENYTPPSIGKWIRSREQL